MYPRNVYETISLLQEGLETIGYGHKSLMLDGKYFSRFTSPAGNSWLTPNYRVSYPFPGASAKEISKDKNLSYALAADAGLVIPATWTVAADEDLAAIWTEAKGSAPLIVKPASSSLSRGLTININDFQTLQQAVVTAREFSPVVLVQRQIKGKEVRFAVVNGKPRAAIYRETPRLIGDGVHTAGELLARENEDRDSLKLPYIKYPQLNQAIIDLTQFDADRVLGDGEVLELGPSAMIRHGASAYNVIDDIHPSYKEAVESFAAGLGAEFVGVDLLLEDYTRPASADNYAFLECNMAPNLGVFYACRDGRQYAILEELVPMIDRALNYRRDT